MSQNFGDYLRARREALGWSLRDVERQTGGKVSNAYLSQIEGGKVANPSLSICHALAQALGVDFGELAECAISGEPPLPRIPHCPTCGRPLLGDLEHGSEKSRHSPEARPADPAQAPDAVAQSTVPPPVL